AVRACQQQRLPPRGRPHPALHSLSCAPHLEPSAVPTSCSEPSRQTPRRSSSRLRKSTSPCCDKSLLIGSPPRSRAGKPQPSPAASDISGTAPESPYLPAHPCTALTESLLPVAPTHCDGAARTPHLDTPPPAAAESLRSAPVQDRL